MDINKYLDEYVTWLRSEITFSEIGEYYEINSPFLDNDNDYIQIYVKMEDNHIYFTDDGYTINRLEMTGFPFTPNRKKQLISILQQYGVSLDGMELTLKASAKEFPQKKHAFIQCILKVNDLCIVSKSRVTSYFLDDIKDYLHEKEIYPVMKVQFTGKSGFSHNYDFVISQTRTKPERLCVAINNPTKTSMSNVLFAWNDTKQVRDDESSLVVLLNDDNAIARGIEEGFNNYDVKTIRWSARDLPENLEMLSA